jgi:hypothetical protein
MTDAMTYYDRALQGLTRRELLNIAWKLGLAAVACVRAADVPDVPVPPRRRVGRTVA